MLKVFFLLILAGALVLLQISAFLIIALIISVIVLLSSYGKYQAAKQKEPSKMVCKNCGSTNVRIHNRTEGWTADSFGGAGYGLAGGRINKNISRQHVAVCADCGFDSPYITLDDIAAERESAKNSVYGSLFITVILSIALIFGVSKINSDNEEKHVSSYSNTEITDVQHPG